MAHTITPVVEEFLKREESYLRFRRALRRADQIVLDDLFEDAKLHLAAISKSNITLPMEAFLLAMILEEHKTIRRLRDHLADLAAQAQPPQSKE